MRRAVKWGSMPQLGIRINLHTKDLKYFFQNARMWIAALESESGAFGELGTVQGGTS